MIEFIVAIVCVVVIFVGILQIGLLGMARTEVMVEARHQAGAMAMLDIIESSLPDYIKDWDEGPDTRPYSADDRSTPGDANAVATRIAAYADPSQVNAVLPDNIITRLERNPEFEIGLGLLKGDARETVPLFPAITHLVYDADEIRVEGDVWIPWTRGIY